ncbi:hypothetical protein OE88DRAFT_1665576 [Heliocybe sulcata]|uniref:Uncharacterized protein n=1 Tax=Heliocybe sulcata TaxID=5364 RepID=A0A5C3MSX9_9AGAM|nr:hypothetical protein OE88DRAFT_1665576 [Heliocybe sulcata]
MSDEYASTGYKGSLVNNSEDGREKIPDATANYPPEGDSTSSGGWGSSSNPHSAASQRGHPEKADNYGLVDQSIQGGPGRQEQDAQQGVDRSSRREYEHEQSQGLNPYGASSMDSRRAGDEALASKYRGSRDTNEYETGATMENDIGA